MRDQQTFQAITIEQDFITACQQFQEEELHSSIPVWVGNRCDLIETIDVSNGLYGSITDPQKADVGILLMKLPEEITEALITPLAKRWITVEQIDLFPTPTSLLIVGLYQDLDWQLVRRLLRDSYETGTTTLGFLTSRDVHSLVWHIAKQWADVAPHVQEIGFFTGVENPQIDAPIRVYGEKAMDQENIQGLVLDQSWKKLLLQGHGKDDSLNLGDFTVCGRNEFIADKEGTQRPCCGYGLPCYKDDARLIPLRSVKAAEIVICSCSSGPLAELSMYDPKYVLQLNAIDGCAKTIIAAVHVHDSSIPENDAWVKHVESDTIPTVTLLNQSLQARHPYPAFWQFGLPPDIDASMRYQREEPVPDGDIIQTMNRLHSYIANDFLPPNYPLRPRFQKLSYKMNLYLSRARLYEDTYLDKGWSKSIWDDVQSVNYMMAQNVVKNPEDNVMSYDSYFVDRSVLEQTTVQEVPCECTYSAQHYQRRGLVNTIPVMNCIVCMRCGDKAFTMEGAPVIRCMAPDRVHVGQSMTAEISLEPVERGSVQIGLFVPTYIRKYTHIEPALQKINALDGMPKTVTFTMQFDSPIPPHSYYFKIFAIQNLGISTYRHRFGVEP